MLNLAPLHLQICYSNLQNNNKNAAIECLNDRKLIETVGCVFFCRRTRKSCDHSGGFPQKTCDLPPLDDADYNICTSTPTAKTTATKKPAHTAQKCNSTTVEFRATTTPQNGLFYIFYAFVLENNIFY